MSAQEAQGLTPKEQVELTSFLWTVTFGGRAEGVMRALVIDAFRAGVLAARAPVQVERPDEIVDLVAKAMMDEDAQGNENESWDAFRDDSDERAAYRASARTAIHILAAARLPEEAA